MSTAPFLLIGGAALPRKNVVTGLDIERAVLLH